MKFTLAFLALATSALANQLNARGDDGYGEDYGDDYGKGGYGGGHGGGHGGGYGGDKTLTTYTTVTTCPVTSTYTKEGSTYCVTHLTTSTIVVTDCKGCVTTVQGPDVTKTKEEVEYTTKTTVCPVTETKTIEGKETTITYTTTKETIVPVKSTVYDTEYGPDITKTEKEVEWTTKTTVCPVTETKTVEGKETTITYTTTKETVVPVKSTVYDTEYGPDVTKTEKEVEWTTKTTVCPVTETKTVGGEVITKVYTTTKETVVAVKSTVYDVVKQPDVTKTEVDVAYHTKTTVCPVTETKTIGGEVVTKVYTTTKETVVAVKTTIYEVVKGPDVTKTELDVAYHTKTSLCPVTETKTVNGEVVTKVYTTTSYIVEKVKTTIPAYKTIYKTVGEAKVETKYSKVLITVGGGTVIETVIPEPTVVEVPATEVVTEPETTKTYEAPPPAVTSPEQVQPGAGHTNKAPAVALMAGLVGAFALL